MRTDDTLADLRRLIAGVVGVLLFVFGCGIAMWVVGIVRGALYHPTDIPLLQLILESDSRELAFSLDKDDDGFSFHGSRLLVLVILVGALLAALGGIVGAFVSGGVKLFRDATWGPRRGKGKEPQS